MSTLLVFFVQSGLLHDHFLKQVLLGLEDQHLAQSLLMLFDSEPIFMVHLKLCNFELSLRVQV